MKKTLLATTMLAGLTLGGAAAAETNVELHNKHLNLTVTGYVYEEIIFWDQDDNVAPAGVQDRQYEFNLRAAEIEFKAEGTTDFGLGYAAELELNLSTSNDAIWDEINLRFDGSWGELRIGDEDAAADIMKLDGNDIVYAVDNGTPLANIFLGTANNGDLVAGLAAGNGGTSLIADWVHPTVDATKISYITPRYAGFKLGASFTPDTGKNMVSAAADNGTDFEEVFDITLEYKEDFDGLGVRVVGSYQNGNHETGTRQDLNIANVAAQVDYAGFSVAVSYADYFDSGLLNDNDGADAGYNLQGGIAYETGPWDLSLGASYFKRDYGAGSEDPSLLVVGGGVGYDVAPGLVVRGDITWFDADTPNAAILGGSVNVENDGYAFVIGTAVKF